MRERLVTTFPILQIAFAAASSAAAFIGGLPEVAFDEAMGPRPLNVGWVDVGNAYKEYGGSARFLPTLVAATLRDPLYNAILLALCLLACAAYWASVQWVSGPAVEAPRLLKPDGTASKPRPPRRDAVLAYISTGGLITVLVVQAWTWPLYAVPSRLKDLGHGVSSEYLDTSTSAIERYAGGTEHYRGLYARFFGVPPEQPARFPSEESDGKPIESTVDEGIRKTVPTDDMFAALLGFYEHLARITTWTLLLLLTFTLLAASPAALALRPSLRVAMGAVLVLATLLHGQQWLSLATAFGRVYVPARTFQRVSQEVVRKPDTIGRPSHWPFWKLDRVTGQVADGDLALVGYWPIRDAGTPALEIWCLRFDGIERQRVESLGPDAPRRPVSGATVFTGVALASYEAKCREKRYSSLVIYDGYSAPLVVDLTGPGTVQ